MSILLNLPELKKEAKHLSIAQLEAVESAIKEVQFLRAQEKDVIQQLESMAKEHGFTLERLGYVQANIKMHAGKSKITPKRMPKPKFKPLRAHSQYFFTDELGQFLLLKAHTMKRSLANRGIEVVPYLSLSSERKKSADIQISEAIDQALISYNSKVDTWNALAAENGLELLSKKTKADL